MVWHRLRHHSREFTDTLSLYMYSNLHALRLLHTCFCSLELLEMQQQLGGMFEKLGRVRVEFPLAVRRRLELRCS